MNGPPRAASLCRRALLQPSRPDAGAAAGVGRAAGDAGASIRYVARTALDQAADSPRQGVAAEHFSRRREDFPGTSECGVVTSVMASGVAGRPRRGPGQPGRDREPEAREASSARVEE